MEYQGITLADSDQAMVLRETRLPPVFYFPREHVRMDLMQRTAYRTHCPFKGNAAHFSLHAGEVAAENVMWSYEDTLDEAGAIRNYVAFYPDQVKVRDEGESPGESELAVAADSNDNPLLEWVVREAPGLATAVDLTASFARRLRESGVPLSRLNIVIQTLHPLISAYSYRWWSKTGEAEIFEADHVLRKKPEFLNSPLHLIFQGAGGIRRRLDINEPSLDYGILKELHAEGATDYVAMPMLFSDGQINAITLTSDRPGGFSTADLGHIYEILSVLGCLYEVHALRLKAVTLLDTYVGVHAGERVLEGRIRRGDGEDIDAVIWFCDLRESTPLAQSMSRAEFLGCLNQFFDCMAGAVLDNGGQVLRFIGDAALAIFPLEDIDNDGGSTTGDFRRAFENALRAVDDARKRIKETNAKRLRKSWAPLKYGIALHVGEVTYGNIGTHNRLEFTVIGDAANQAARIESLCKQLDKPVLLSGEFARRYPGRFDSLGLHELRGISEPQELFFPRE